jgi:hypothetical protein
VSTLRIDTARAGGALSRVGFPTDRSELDIVAGDARLLVIDPSGARSGLDSASGKYVSEIPQSQAYEDRIDNDVTGEPAESFDMTVHIARPAEGTYRVVVLDLSSKSKELMVAPYAIDGTGEPFIHAPLNREKTRRVEFRLHFQKAPGSTSSLERI